MEEKNMEEPWTEEEVFRTVKTFPPLSATGLDQWRVRDFLRPPQPGRAELVEMLNPIEAEQAMPAQCLGNLVALKP
eukprot:3042879-Pyramimonas_sp.AAC.1